MIRRVLVVQPYGLGDMLFISPVLRALRLIPGLERVDMLVGSRTKNLIQANPHIDDIYVIDKDLIHKNSKAQNFRFLKDLGCALKKNRYDLLLDYSIRGEYAFWSRFFLGIPKCAGYAYKKRAFFHNIKLPIPNGFEGRHVVDFVCDLAEKAGVPVKDRFVEFFFSDEESRELEKNLTPKLPATYFALSLGGGESWGPDAHLKRWPVARFIELAKYLIQRNSTQKIVLVGSAGEKELAVEFLKSAVSFSLPAIDFTGQLSISETAWVLKKSCFFLGNDGGLLHLARAVFKPVIGIYGPADPAVYGPYQQSSAQSLTPGVACNASPGVDSVRSLAIYKPPTDGKPRYSKFRYDKHDRTLQDLSVEDAIKMVENSSILNGYQS